MKNIKEIGIVNPYILAKVVGRKNLFFNKQSFKKMG